MFQLKLCIEITADRNKTPDHAEAVVFWWLQQLFSVAEPHAASGRYKRGSGFGTEQVGRGSSLGTLLATFGSQRYPRELGLAC